MSTHPKLLGKIIRMCPGKASMSAGRLPAQTHSRADPYLAAFPSGISPGLLGKIIPSNSGIVPMTAGHLPI
jgi:hypothetical protein